MKTNQPETKPVGSSTVKMAEDSIVRESGPKTLYRYVCTPCSNTAFTSNSTKVDQSHPAHCRNCGTLVEVPLKPENFIQL